MNDAFRRLLTAKLDDPDEVVRAHARARLDAEPPYPSLATQASNLAGAVRDWAASGFGLASEEEQARRLEICRGCPLWDLEQGRCTACGCYTTAKTKMQSSVCPEGKW